jgi:hypothetical protein
MTRNDRKEVSKMTNYTTTFNGSARFPINVSRADIFPPSLELYLSYAGMINVLVKDGYIDGDTLFENTPGEEWEVNSGDIYDEYGNPVEPCNYYIISEKDADRLARHTNEIIFYNDNLHIYMLAVTHGGTAWEYVETDYAVTVED